MKFEPSIPKELRKDPLYAPVAIIDGSQDVSVAPVAITDGSQDVSVLLPEGWERRFTPEGKAYFVDHKTKTTHWTLPQLVV